jgi:hypothetical protein
MDLITSGPLHVTEDDMELARDGGQCLSAWRREIRH